MHFFKYFIFFIKEIFCLNIHFLITVYIYQGYWFVIILLKGKIIYIQVNLVIFFFKHCVQRNGAVLLYCFRADLGFYIKFINYIASQIIYISKTKSCYTFYKTNAGNFFYYIFKTFFPSFPPWIII